MISILELWILHTLIITIICIYQNKTRRGFKMNAHQIELTIRHYIDNRFTHGLSKEDQCKKSFVKQMCFGELKLSIQASEGHYCHPRENTTSYNYSNLL